MEQRHVPVTAFWALPDDFYACSKQRLGDEAKCLRAFCYIALCQLSCLRCLLDV